VSVLVCTERSERERESGRSDGRCSTSTTKVQDRCIVSRGPGCCCCCWLLSFSHSISVGVTLLHLFDRQSLNSRGVLTRSWYSARRWETMILVGTWRRCGTVKELRHADTTPICGLSSATSRSALCYDFMRVTYGLFFNAWPYTIDLPARTHVRAFVLGDLLTLVWLGPLCRTMLFVRALHILFTTICN